MADPFDPKNKKNTLDIDLNNIDVDKIAQNVEAFWNEDFDLISTDSALLQAFPTVSVSPQDAPFIEMPIYSPVGQMARTPEGLRTLRKFRRELFQDLYGITDVDKLIEMTGVDEEGDAVFSPMSISDIIKEGEGEEFSMENVLGGLMEEKAPSRIEITPWTTVLSTVYGLMPEEVDEILAVSDGDIEKVAEELAVRGIPLGDVEKKALELRQWALSKGDKGMALELDELLRTIQLIKTGEMPTIGESWASLGAIEKEWWQYVPVVDTIGEIVEGLGDIFDRDAAIESGLARFVFQNKYTDVMKKFKECGFDCLSPEEAVTALIGMKKDLGQYMKTDWKRTVLGGTKAAVDFSLTVLLTRGMGASATVTKIPGAAKVMQAFEALGKFKAVPILGKALSNPGILATSFVEGAPQFLDYMVPHVGLSKTEEDYLVSVLDKEPDSFMKALAKYSATSIIDTWTETMGDTLVAAAKKFPGVEQVLKRSFVRHLLNKRGIKTVMEGTDVLRKIGWHGVVGEILEEELSGLTTTWITDGWEAWSRQIPFITKESWHRMAVTAAVSTIMNTGMSLTSMGLKRVHLIPEDVGDDGKPDITLAFMEDRGDVYEMPAILPEKEGDGWKVIEGKSKAAKSARKTIDTFLNVKRVAETLRVAKYLGIEDVSLKEFNSYYKNLKKRKNTGFITRRLGIDTMFLGSPELLKDFVGKTPADLLGIMTQKQLEEYNLLLQARKQKKTPNVEKVELTPDEASLRRYMKTIVDRMTQLPVEEDVYEDMIDETSEREQLRRRQNVVANILRQLSSGQITEEQIESELAKYGMDLKTMAQEMQQIMSMDVKPAWVSTDIKGPIYDVLGQLKSPANSFPGFLMQELKNELAADAVKYAESLGKDINELTEKEVERLRQKLDRKLEKLRPTLRQAGRILSRVWDVLKRGDVTFENERQVGWFLVGIQAIEDFAFGKITEERLVNILRVVDLALHREGFVPIFDPLTHMAATVKKLIEYKPEVVGKKGAKVLDFTKVGAKPKELFVLAKGITQFDLKLYSTAIAEDKDGFVQVVYDMVNALLDAGVEDANNAAMELRAKLLSDVDSWMKRLKDHYEAVLSGKEKRLKPVFSVIINQVSKLRDVLESKYRDARIDLWATRVMLGKVSMERVPQRLKPAVQRVVEKFKSAGFEKKELLRLEHMLSIQRLPMLINGAFLLSVIDAEETGGHWFGDNSLLKDVHVASLPVTLNVISNTLGINFDIRRVPDLYQRKGVYAMILPKDRTIYVWSGLKKDMLEAHAILHEIGHFFFTREGTVSDTLLSFSKNLRSAINSNVENIVRLIKNIPADVNPYEYLLHKVDKLKNLKAGKDALMLMELLRLSAWATPLTGELATLVSKGKVNTTTEALQAVWKERIRRYTADGKIARGSFSNWLAHELLANAMWVAFTKPVTLQTYAPMFAEVLKKGIQEDTRLRQFMINYVKGITDKKFFSKLVIENLMAGGIYADMMVEHLYSTRYSDDWGDFIGTLVEYGIDKWWNLERITKQIVKETETLYGEEQARRVRESMRQKMQRVREYAKFKRRMQIEVDPYLTRLAEIRESIQDKPMRTVVWNLVNTKLLLERVANDKEYASQLAPGPLGLTSKKAKQVLSDWGAYIEDLKKTLVGKQFPTELVDNLDALVDKTYEQVREVLTDVTTRTLDIALESGLINKKTYDKYMEGTGWYVRVQRLSKLFNQFNILDTQTIGSLDNAGKPIDATIMMLLNTIHAAERNKAKAGIISILSRADMARPHVGEYGKPVRLEQQGWVKTGYFENGQYKEYFIPKGYVDALESSDEITNAVLGFFRKLATSNIYMMWVLNPKARLKNFVKDTMKAVFMGLGLSTKGHISIGHLMKNYVRFIKDYSKIAEGNHEILQQMVKEGLVPTTKTSEYKQPLATGYTTLQRLFEHFGITDQETEDQLIKAFLEKAKGDPLGDVYVQELFGMTYDQLKQHLKDWKTFKKHFKKVRGVLDKLIERAETLEYVHKMAFYMALKEQQMERLKQGKEALSDTEIYEIINKYVGNPDTLGYRGKWGSGLGSFFPFWQTYVNSIRFYLSGFTEKYFTQATWLGYVGTAIMSDVIYFLGIYGIFDLIMCNIFGTCDEQKWKKIIGALTREEYMRNIVIPVPFVQDDDGNMMYIKIPKDPGMVWASKIVGPIVKLKVLEWALDNLDPKTQEYKELYEKYKDEINVINSLGIMDIVDEMSPEVMPWIDAVMQWLNYLNGIQPVDKFTGRPIVTEDEVEFKTKEGWSKMMAWTLDKMGLNGWINARSVLRAWQYNNTSGKAAAVFTNSVLVDLPRSFVKFGGYGQLTQAYEERDLLKTLEKQEVFRRQQKLVEYVNTLLDEGYKPFSGDPEKFNKLWETYVYQIWGRPYKELRSWEKREAIALKNKMRGMIVEGYYVRKRTKETLGAGDKLAFQLYATAKVLGGSTSKREKLIREVERARSILGERQFKKYLAALWELGYINESFLKSILKEEPQLLQEFIQ